MRFIILLICMTSFSAHAQNTLSLPENGISPDAELSQIAWMEGHWKGEAFGGLTEELWSPPFGGSMMFSFKLVVYGEIAFYEFG